LYIQTQLAYVYSSDLRKIPRAMDPNKRNYCVNRGLSACGTTTQITGNFAFTAERISVLQRIKDKAA